MANIDASEGLTVGKDTTLDLGTYKLNISTNDSDYVYDPATSKDNTFSGIVINGGSTLTVEGSTTGEINYTTSRIDSDSATYGDNPDSSKITTVGNYIEDTIKKLREIAAIKVGDSTAEAGTNAGLVVNGGTIKSNSTAICAGNGTSVSIAGGTVESTYSTGIYVGNKNGRSNQTADNITLNISGGTVRSAETSSLPAIQVSGTLSTNTTTINITGGKVEYANKNTQFNSDDKSYGNPDAIYAGGNVDLNILAGEVTSGGTGIELRGGKLNVTGGTITSTATTYKVNENQGKSSGGQVYGAAIGMVQHTTGLNVETEVEAGEISGQIALAVENTTDAKGTQTISAEITGGTFTSTGTGTAAIAAKTSDTRSTITIDGKVTFKGTVESTFAQTDDTTTPTITFGENADVTVITVDENGNETTTTYDSTSVQFTEEWTETVDGKAVKNTQTYPVNDKAWNASKENPAQKFFYLVANEGSNIAGRKVILAPKSGSNNTLELTSGVTSGDSFDSIVALDLTNDSFSELFGSASKFKTVSAASITSAQKIKFDITGNDVITAITGGANNDSLTAGAAGVSLNGGAGNDLLTGGDGADTFIFTAGKDTIAGYDKEDDIVSIDAGLTAPIDFDNVSYDGSDFAISLGSADNVLTFQSKEAFSITNGTDTYSYAGNKNGIESIAKEGDGISLGAGFTSKNYNGTELNYQTIDARKVTGSLTIRGNDTASSLFGAIGGGAVYGGMNADSLQSNTTLLADSIGTILDGGDGNDLLIGSTGKDTFVYSAGADSIQGYGDGDLVNIKQLNIADAIYSVGTAGSNTNISLNFGNGDNLTFENINNGAVSVKASGGNYVYTKDYYSHNGNSVFLAKDYTGPFNGLADSVTAEYVTINAAAVSGAVSIVGNDKNNNIVGSETATGGTLYGGKGNDKLDVTERATGAKFVLQYTEGKDTVDGFVAGDKLNIDDTLVSSISKAKSSKGGTKLEFTFGKSKVLTFKGDDEIASVSLQDGTGFLTKDGVVTFASASDNTNNATEEEKSSTDTGTQTDTEGTSDDTQTDTAAATTASLKLFASARGKIDLTEAPYASAGIVSVNASDVKKQSVTIIGASVDADYTFADKNKKKDQFNYGGGDVTISNYESGVDKLELGTASLSGFKVTNNNSDVSLNADGKTISLVGAAGSEVMLHHAGSTRSSFTKMVFAADNVILNKSKRPTMATVSGDYSVPSDKATIKKIFVAENLSGASIVAGDKTKTTIDASAAGTASGGTISLIGGAKNDKLIGSTSSLVADTFIYTGGKDIIENYNYSGDSGDKISISDFDSSLTSAKISAGKRSIKFKFGSKDALTIKPSKGASLGGSLNIDGVNSGYTYSKNAIASGSNASLTSQFSGSYKLKDKGITNVDGALVEKNLTYKGTSATETLSGGTKKTTFKGGGGNDAFTGGTGKDIFFYAKGDKGDATIANFDVSSDKVKIASGTITSISSAGSGIKFNMNSGRKGSANVGSFTINNLIGGYDSNGTLAAGTQTLIKANNTYLWFADKSGTDVSGNSFAQGALITSDKKISKSAVGSDCAVIDLGYSTNLVKAGVAYKVENATWSSGTQNQESNG